MTDSKTPRKTYSEETKQEVIRLLKEGKTHGKIQELTGVGQGTIATLARSTKSSTESGIHSTSSDLVVLLRKELRQVQQEKAEVEKAILENALQKRLDILEAKEKQLEDTLKFYQSGA